MLDIEMIDLGDLARALEDNAYEHTSWFDPTAGVVEVCTGDDSVDTGEEPEERGWLPIAPIESHDAYRDLEDFASCVRDPRARQLLERAIQGRGAFRRFKDVLFDFPELRDTWFRFHDTRMERRAIEWLVEHALIDREHGERAIAQRPDPVLPEISGPFDADAVAAAVARDLGRLYGSRLRHVLLFGSWARGDSHPDSDIDMLVVLDDLAGRARWDEVDRMDEILWRHSYENDTVVTAIPVSEHEFEQQTRPFIRRARSEGREVA